MTYILKISYFDQEPEREEYGSLDEAIEAYQSATDQRDQLGQSFGDVSRMAVISHHGATYKTICARDYD